MKVFIPFINKFYQFSKYNFNENNKTYNKLVGISMQREKDKVKNPNQVINRDFTGKNYSEEHPNNTNNYYNNRSINDNKYFDEKSDNNLNSNLQKNYNINNQGSLGFENSRNLYNQINNIKSRRDGNNYDDIPNDSVLEKDFRGI